MRILFLTYYFPPDLSAGSFRSSSLVTELRAQLKSEANIEVITTLPNRYSTFNSKAIKHEKKKGITIHRINLPKHDNSMLAQCKGFLVYVVFSVIFFII